MLANSQSFRDADYLCSVSVASCDRKGKEGSLTINASSKETRETAGNNFSRKAKPRKNNGCSVDRATSVGMGT